MTTPQMEILRLLRDKSCLFILSRGSKIKFWLPQFVYMIYYIGTVSPTTRSYMARIAWSELLWLGVISWLLIPPPPRVSSINISHCRGPIITKRTPWPTRGDKCIELHQQLRFKRWNGKSLDKPYLLPATGGVIKSVDELEPLLYTSLTWGWAGPQFCSALVSSWEFGCSNANPNLSELPFQALSSEHVCM